MKSKPCGFGEIKSVPQPDEVGFHREAISPIEDGFIPSQTDLVEKERHTVQRVFLFLGSMNLMTQIKNALKPRDSTRNYLANQKTHTRFN